MRLPPTFLLLLPVATALAAESTPATPPASAWSPAPAAPAPTEGPWSWELKLGAFLQDIATRNADTSRDPGISGTHDSTSYKLTGDGSAVWREGDDRVGQRLSAEYGRVRSAGQDWSENADTASYDGTYERSLASPHLVYLNWHGESQFTGPDPDRRRFDPLVAKGSGGYGQRWEGLLPLSDALVWRSGVYARKRWEHGAEPSVTRVEAGPELYGRYERKQSEDVGYYLENEVSSELLDPRHVTNVTEARLAAKVAKTVTLEVRLRAYYEARPRDVGQDAPGYSEWSLHEETLLGLLWTFTSAP